MVAIKGHFDGKVIVPDEPLNLQPNQRLIVHVEPVTDHTTDFRSWIGLGNAAPQNPNPRFNSDDDLWG
jgi:hypothetical protein